MKTIFILDNEICFTDKENIGTYKDARIIKDITLEEYNNFMKLRDSGNYLYEKDNVVKNCSIPKGVRIKFNIEKEIFEDIATLEEQEKFYREKIIDLNKRIVEIETSGFGASDLKIELENLKLKHQEVTHLLGLEIDKTII